MKKLLALVLCVMMFVSVLSTNAFAAKATEVDALNYPTATNLPAAGMLTTKSANDAISHAKKNIEYMYGTLAADNAVFGTVKNMDDVINGMITNIFEGTTGSIAGLPVDTLKDNVKAYVKDVIGGSIIGYLDDNFSDFATVSWDRKADATKQTLNFSGKQIKGHTADTWLFQGPAGKVYLQKLEDDGSVTWHTTNADLDTAAAGRASWTELATAPVNVAGTTYELSVPKSSLSYTGKSFVGGAGNLNYLYTGANGQVYAYNTKTENWRKTDATIAEVLAGTATWSSADVTLTEDVDYDPIKYANTFAAAVSDAFNSKQGAANVQAIMYQLYSAKVLDEVNEKLDDLADEIRTWENSSTLLDNYHFNEGLFVPYAFLSEFDTPETLFELPTYVWAP